MDGTRFYSAALAAALVLVACCSNESPRRLIRFKTSKEADSHRARLISFIWEGAIPSTMPEFTGNVSLPPEASGITIDLIAKIDKLDANVSGWDFHAVSYILHPKSHRDSKDVVLLHQGHSNDLGEGIDQTANHLLGHGFTVVLMAMPLFAWNTDRGALIEGRTVTFRNHDDIIRHFEQKRESAGWGFRFFLEPVVQNINYMVANHGVEDVSMIGLSGGGWTTSMIAAIDQRVRRSVPVAGSAPLYHRYVENHPDTLGDAEQTFALMFSEEINEDGKGGGIATWLEIYALGGYGSKREQVQVSNEFDSCCFSGRFHVTYEEVVASRVRSLGKGRWRHMLDSTHHGHRISPYTLTEVINPLLGIPKPQ